MFFYVNMCAIYTGHHTTGVDQNKLQIFESNIILVPEGGDKVFL